MGRGQLRGARRSCARTRPRWPRSPRCATGCPSWRHVIVIDPAGEVGDAVSLDELRERGRRRDPAELAARSEAVTLEDPFTFIYTSGTTGPPKGCVLTHGNYRSMLDMCNSLGVFETGQEITYLYLPLAHAFALLIQLLSVDLGGTIAYFSGDTKQIVPELQEIQPTYFPSVPRIFEKIYTLATSAIQQGSESDREQLREAVEVGVRVRDLREHGEEVPAELEATFEQAEEQLFKNVRAIFGGRVRQAVTGAAPIAQEILEFFYACGVPVLEGYGMTETATAATYSTIAEHKFGTVGRPFPGCRGQDRRRRRDPGQGVEHLPRLLQERRRQLRRRGRRMAAHRRPGVDRRGRLPVDHRAQEGHHHHGGRQEPHAGEHRERPQAVALGLPGRHARRPAPVPGRADHPRRGGDRALGRGARPARRTWPRSPRTRRSTR